MKKKTKMIKYFSQPCSSFMEAEQKSKALRRYRIPVVPDLTLSLSLSLSHATISSLLVINKGDCIFIYATCLPSRKLSKLDEPDMQDTAGEAGTSS